MLILGGAAVINALSGMNIYAACFLIPLSSTPFTSHGPARNGPLMQSLGCKSLNSLWNYHRTCSSSLSNCYPEKAGESDLEMGIGAPAGGLLATYISAWGHVAMVYCVMLIFLWKVIR